MWVGKSLRSRTDHEAKLDMFEQKLKAKRPRRLGRLERLVGVVLFGGLIVAGVVAKLVLAG